MLIPFIVMAVFAKEPPDREHQTLKEHISCLFEKDGWVFNLVYIITFGGFIGLSSFLPTYFYDQFGVSKIEAGQLTMLAALMEVVFGFLVDIFQIKREGSQPLAMFLDRYYKPFIYRSSIFGFMGHHCFMLCFAALGAGNGALFQLVP